VVGDDHVVDRRPLSSADAALAYVAERAFRSAPAGPVGLELEGHLVDRRSPGRRPSWAEVTEIVAGAPQFPGRSGLSVEPGGQLELSSPPAHDLASAIADLRRDERALSQVLRGQGYGLAFLGTDPCRREALINPSPRYTVMARYFDSRGCGDDGRLIMTASAGLQLNLEAGPAAEWPERLARLQRLGPVLAAISGCSPIACGRSTGWASMRQQAWIGIDRARTAPVRFGDDPALAWADYALAAPLMLVNSAADTGTRHPTKATVGRIEDAPPGLTFAEWIRFPARVGRAPTPADLDYHLTTLFPPIRPRGYLELRFLDAVPLRWWPGLVAVVGTLIDHPDAADAVAELLAGTELDWLRVAQLGLRDPAVRRVATGCLRIAIGHCPSALHTDAAVLGELIEAGRTPGDWLLSRASGDGCRLLQEASED
jgi:ergothioneine biosynthesis glutamate--cysteine ligase EgtA